MQPMHEEELDHFLSLTLRDEAAAHEARLANVEEKIMERLRPTPSARSLPAFRWGLATAGVLAAIILGIAIGYWLKPTEPGRLTLASHQCGPSYGNGLRSCEFIVFDDQAESVQLVGSFTGWEPVALEKTAEGVWTKVFTVQGNSQRFAFVINGQNWKIYKGCPKTFEFMGRQECVLNL